MRDFKGTGRNTVLRRKPASSVLVESYFSQPTSKIAKDTDDQEQD